VSRRKLRDPELFAIKWHEQGRRCRYCVKLTNLHDGVLDHVLPLSKGGSNLRRNLVFACRVCDKLKADLVFEGVPSLEEILAKRAVVRRAKIAARLELVRTRRRYEIPLRGPPRVTRRSR